MGHGSILSKDFFQLDRSAKLSRMDLFGSKQHRFFDMIEEGMAPGRVCSCCWYRNSQQLHCRQRCSMMVLDVRYRRQISENLGGSHQQQKRHDDSCCFVCNENGDCDDEVSFFRNVDEEPRLV
jgi:hypothetical protein